MYKDVHLLIGDFMEIIKTDLAIELENKYHHEFSFIPKQGTSESAGYDVRACIDEEVFIYPNQVETIPLGFKLHIANRSIVGLVVPRSGLGGNEGYVLGNLVGVIDSDYQKEWMLKLWNRTDTPIRVKPTMRIAQVLFTYALHPTFTEKHTFTVDTPRLGGFGHTGVM